MYVFKSNLQQSHLKKSWTEPTIDDGVFKPDIDLALSSIRNDS